MSWMLVYKYCLGIGFILLLLTFLLDAFDSILDDIDFDFLDIDIGDFELALLPISMRALCLAAVIFGSVGLLLKSVALMPRNIIAGLLAYISAVVIQTIKKYLKSHQSLASNKELLLMSESIVVNTIADNGFGSICTKRINDSDISTTAKSKTGESIKQGTKVRVVELKDNFVIVEPLQ